MELPAMKSILSRTILSRWMVVVAGFFIMSSSGAIYAFGVYSEALKLALHYNQKTLNTIGFFKDFGNVGILAGLIADLAPAWVVLSIGVSFNTFGYLMIWLAVVHKISKPALWQMYLYITVGGNSVAFTHAGALVTCVKNFPLHRGMIVGLLKGFLGLSSAMLTLLYHAIYGSKQSSFILLIVYVPFVVTLSFMFLIRPIPLPVGDKIEDEKKVFYKLLAVELTVAGYLMVVILIQHSVELKQFVNEFFATVMVLILCSPIAMIVRMEMKKLSNENGKELFSENQINQEFVPSAVASEPERELKEKKRAEEDDQFEQKQLEQNPSEMAASQEISTKRRCSLTKFWQHVMNPPRIGQDFSVWQALFHLDFWILSVAATCGFGAGLMAIDNLGQVGAAFGYDADKTSTFVSLISIWNCLGRVGAGFVSEIFLQKTGLPRPLFFALSLAISAVGHLVIGLRLPGALFIGSILIGLCFGALWSLLHIIVSEIYGLKYYGTLQSIIAMASPLGTYLLSVRVAGYLYDRETEKQNLISRKNSNECHGKHCYDITFYIMAAVCSFGCILTMFMVIRTRKFYRTEVFEKLKVWKLEMAELKGKEKPHNVV